MSSPSWKTSTLRRSQRSEPSTMARVIGAGRAGAVQAPACCPRKSGAANARTGRRILTWDAWLATGLAVLVAATASIAFSATASTVVAQGLEKAPIPGAPSGADRSESRRATEDARRVASGNLVGHGGPIKAVRIDVATGHVLTGSFDYAMMAWDISGPEPRQLGRFADHDGAVNAVAFVPGGNRVLSAGDDGTVSIWDLETGQLVHRFSGHEGKIVGLSVSEDGRWAASASWDRTARIWDLERLEAGPVLSGHTGPVNAVAFSADGARVFTASYDGSIGAFRRSDGSFERPVYRHGWGINVLERLPGSDRLVFGSLNGSAGIVEAESGVIAVELQSHERPVLALAVLEKPSLIATGSADGTIHVVRADDGAVIEKYQNPYGPIWALAFTSEGRSLYYGGLDDFATLWHVQPRQPFEPIASPFPRRFQLTGEGDDAMTQGQIQFARKCSVCHTLTPDGANRAGPTLYGLFGRRVGTLPGYPYSEALKQLDIVWTEETVSRLFELGPDEYTPGSKMPLQKMTDKEQRDALVAFLKAATAPSPAGDDAAGGKGSDTKGGMR